MHLGRPPKYFKFIGDGKVLAYVISKGRGTYIRLPSSWYELQKDIYITFQDNTELKVKMDTMDGYPIANIPAIYANQQVTAQTSDGYE